ncbi:hypothetical protein HPB49_021691 [Dermacentor silvarum]|uniref:Uncharacterized protein n=1 Tax=Dermacentor silvarum TaxID=543639 RepID=A0ACB8D871_DERSI|nr:hypothetical protein HPB49_021691 [Dermacentor silvarum]
MHFVSGNSRIAVASLPPMTDGCTPPVRIAQRMRLEQTQLEGVARKMQMVDEHCILLALPCGRDHMDVLQQSNNLRNGFINYLQLKQAAGIVNAAAPGSQQPAYVIHIFPSCEFSNENLARIAPDLLHSCQRHRPLVGHHCHSVNQGRVGWRRPVPPRYPQQKISSSLVLDNKDCEV